MLTGNTPPWVFFQIKQIFHLLESIGSARIEGNHTTLAELVDRKIEQIPINKNDKNDEKFLEIENMEKALRFIEKNNDNSINKLFLSEIHKIITKGLSVELEGCRQPGYYRTDNVRINQAKHVPSNHCFVEDYMRELFDFIEDTSHRGKSLVT